MKKQFLLTYESQKHVHLSNQVSAQSKSIRRTFKVIEDLFSYQMIIHHACMLQGNMKLI